MAISFGFIGTGNMGGALARAAVKGGVDAVLFDKAEDKAKALADQLGCQAGSLADAAACDYIFLGVKPQMMAALFAELAPILEKQENFILVSMAAGIPIADIRKLAGKDYPVIRIMPNIPVSAGSGVIMYATTENVSEEAATTFCKAMGQAGLLDPIPEALIDAGSAISGCGPAFAAMFIEALADGGVICGLPRDKAMDYAACMLEGTAKMLRETKMHPGALKDAVCSPGGSTIAGVQALEDGGFRSAAISAVTAAYYRTKELGK